MARSLPIVLLAVACFATGAVAQPAETHAENVDRRGDQAMTFSHEKATHHFRLTSDGGAIQVTANDPADHATCDQIRAHLRMISQRFAQGDFSMPMFIHGRTPPGVPTMKRLRKEIRYRFVPLPAGGEVRISSHDAGVIEAIHKFLRFQIQDHRTGDPTTIQR